MRTRPEVGFDATDEGDDLVVDGLIHHSAFPVVLGRLSTVACLKKLQPLVLLHRHHRHNRPPMLGDRHRFGAGQVDQPAEAVVLRIFRAQSALAYDFFRFVR